ncbi:MAG: DUF4357 domain-containing protein, partial [Corynebacterium sp.]|nr:DUF4357 domain-containing protein [Corynebacterium sp.]
ISTSARMRIEGNPLERESRFILLAGSELSPHIAYEPAGRLRQIYADSISNLKVTKDIVLKSPTQPAQIVAGASRNGWVYWKDSAGNTLHDRFRASEDL